MTRRKIIPAYRLHSQTGKAIVTVYDAAGRRQGNPFARKIREQGEPHEYQTAPRSPQRQRWSPTAARGQEHPTLPLPS